VTERGIGERGEPALDTIVAQATLSGISALAVVRISGPDALRILARLTGGEDTPAPRRAALLPLHDPEGELVDRGVVTFFQAPDSYTGQDLLEISCHGGWLVPARIVESCLSLGARQAEPGEFTRRAVLHGKMDLIQAEGVVDLIEGRSVALHRAAIHQIERGLSQRISTLREGLVRLEALLVHHLDFPEEDDAPVPLDRVAQEGYQVLSALESLAATAPEGELLREGALTVLAGRPNAGKSSLFNALLGRERAIVTHLPGTTRDALECVVQIGGFPFRLVDTAGLREALELIERMGVEVAERYLEDADLILYCVESGRSLDESELEFLSSLGTCPVLLISTMSDLRGQSEVESECVTPESLGENGGSGDPYESVRVSALSGAGLDDLQERLPALVYAGLVQVGADSPVLTRERQARAVKAAAWNLQRFIEDLQSGVPAEMAATHLRPAATALEELLGVISTDDVLDRVFSDFCVGK
jgi:tRNA modification GTPase